MSKKEKKKKKKQVSKLAVTVVSGWWQAKAFSIEMVLNKGQKSKAIGLSQKRRREREVGYK